MLGKGSFGGGILFLNGFIGRIYFIQFFFVLEVMEVKEYGLVMLKNLMEKFFEGE